MSEFEFGAGYDWEAHFAEALPFDENQIELPAAKEQVENPPDGANYQSNIESLGQFDFGADYDWFAEALPSNENHTELPLAEEHTENTRDTNDALSNNDLQSNDELSSDEYDEDGSLNEVSPSSDDQTKLASAEEQNENEINPDASIVYSSSNDDPTSDFESSADDDKMDFDYNEASPAKQSQVKRPSSKDQTKTGSNAADAQSNGSPGSDAESIAEEEDDVDPTFPPGQNEPGFVPIGTAGIASKAQGNDARLELSLRPRIVVAERDHVPGLTHVQIHSKYKAWGVSKNRIRGMYRNATVRREDRSLVVVWTESSVNYFPAFAEFPVEFTDINIAIG